MLRNIDWYLDTAKARQGTLSDRQLSIALGRSTGAVFDFRRGFSFPSDDTQIKLGQMAGVPASEALMDLNIWRAKSTEVRSAYQKIAAQLKGAAIIAALALPLFTPVSSEARVEPVRTLYIMLNRIVRWRRRFSIYRAIPLKSAAISIA